MRNPSNTYDVDDEIKLTFQHFATFTKKLTCVTE